MRRYPIVPDRLQGIQVWRDGALATTVWGPRLPPDQYADRRPDELSAEEVAARLRRLLEIGLDVLLELGAHGDVALAFSVPEGLPLHWRGHFQDSPGIAVTQWIALDLESEAREQVVSEVVGEVGRALGAGPEPLGDDGS
jgi:hypothetical protein